MSGKIITWERIQDCNFWVSPQVCHLLSFVLSWMAYCHPNLNLLVFMLCLAQEHKQVPHTSVICDSEQKFSQVSLQYVKNGSSLCETHWPVLWQQRDTELFTTEEDSSLYFTYSGEGNELEVNDLHYEVTVGQMALGCQTQSFLAFNYLILVLSVNVYVECVCVCVPRWTRQLRSPGMRGCQSSSCRGRSKETSRLPSISSASESAVDRCWPLLAALVRHRHTRTHSYTHGF